ncbi:MAG: hypothetical protein AAB731_05360 [Patescibacteria group bacterium]
MSSSTAMSSLPNGGLRGFLTWGHPMCYLPTGRQALDILIIAHRTSGVSKIKTPL